jgi:hypothetical protein
MMAFFFVKGIDSLNLLKLNKNKYTLNKLSSFIKMVYIFYFFVSVVFMYVSNLKGGITLYSKNAYDNYGAAIEKAYDLDVPIIMLESAVPWHHVLVIRTHPYFNVEKQVPVYKADGKENLCQDPKIKEMQKYVLVDKYNFKIIDYDYLCSRGLLSDLVNRFYSSFLKRTATKIELDGWVDRLKSGVSSAKDFADHLILKKEFFEQRIMDEDFLILLYRALLNRDPDPRGLKYWLNALSGDKDRIDALKSFAHSREFRQLCTKYKIRPF